MLVPQRLVGVKIRIGQYWKLRSQGTVWRIAGRAPGQKWYLTRIKSVGTGGSHSQSEKTIKLYYDLID